jgi:hypothetical protein
VLPPQRFSVSLRSIMAMATVVCSTKAPNKTLFPTLDHTASVDFCCRYLPCSFTLHKQCLEHRDGSLFLPLHPPSLELQLVDIELGSLPQADWLHRVEQDLEYVSAHHTSFRYSRLIFLNQVHLRRSSCWSLASVRYRSTIIPSHSHISVLFMRFRSYPDS